MSVTDGTVVAVVTARTSRDLIIATTTKVICWRAADSTIQPIFSSGKSRRVLGLATDSTATCAYVLYGEGVDLYLRCISLGSHGRFEQDGQIKFENVPGSGTDWYLKPMVVAASKDDPAGVVMLTNRHGCFAFKGPNLNACTPRMLVDAHSAFLIADDSDNGIWLWDHRGLDHPNTAYAPTNSLRVSWAPGIPAGNCMTVANLDWTTNEGELDIVGLDTNGYVNTFHVAHTSVHSLNFVYRVSTTDNSYTAACLLGPGVIAAATRTNEIAWLIVRDGKMLPYRAVTRLNNTQPIVALATISQLHIIAVLANGSVIRIRHP
ncbi:hypothetical protein BH11PLA2_BH11PLA2_37440 [soil metagenome]